MPTLRQGETGLWRAMLYPFRSVEAIGFLAIMGGAFWGLMVLVPEYCLALWADANLLGTPSMGMLIILISAIPGLLILPFLLVYFLQYLGRVLVSSAQGLFVPPRAPDRNFEGFADGLSPWLAWLVLGVPVGFLPLELAWLSGGVTEQAKVFVLGSLLVFGVPYAAVSLMLSFLHEQSLAATPWGVIGTLARNGRALVPTLLRLVAVVGLTALAVRVAGSLREGYIGIYLLFALACWWIAIWASLVTLRLLGLHYHHHRESLGWNPHQSRWGVRWRL